MRTITPKLHIYGPINKIIEILALISLIVFVAMGLFFLYAIVNSYIGGNSLDINSLSSALVSFLTLVIWSPLICLFVGYIYPDVEVQNDGITIRFLLKKYLIKWDEIIEIKPSSVYGLFTNKNAKAIIVKNKLTFFHRLYGLLYAGRYTPAFLVHRKISEYDLLMETISTQAKNKSVETVSK